MDKPVAALLAKLIDAPMLGFTVTQTGQGPSTSVKLGVKIGTKPGVRVPGTAR